MQQKKEEAGRRERGADVARQKGERGEERGEEQH